MQSLWLSELHMREEKSLGKAVATVFDLSPSFPALMPASCFVLLVSNGFYSGLSPGGLYCVVYEEILVMVQSG